MLGRLVAACRVVHAAGGPVPSAALAEVTGWSERQLHRRFGQVLGSTPRQYGEAVRVGRVGPALRAAGRVSEAAFGVGYGSVRGFYEQAGPRLGLEPRRYAAGGVGEQLVWSTVPCRLPGTGADVVLAVVSRRGVVAVRLGSDERRLLGEVAAELPHTQLTRDDEALAEVMGALVSLAQGVAAPRLPLDVRGTAFQASVWAALRAIPSGQTRSYAQVASEVGRPAAVRAVASACAVNPLSLVVPCHRVIRGDGGLGGFRWGLAVKQSLLRAEREHGTSEAVVQPATA